MARAAKSVKDDPAKVAKNQKTARGRQRQSDLSSKTFEDLLPSEKDQLLKALGVGAGLIQDSDDT